MKVQTELRRPRRARLALELTAVCLALAALAVMGMLTLRSSDDIFYQYFLRDGLANYLARMRWHYVNFNGRVLVHVADHIVLYLGNWAFALSLCAVCALIPWLAARSAGRPARDLPGLLALFLPGVLLMPGPVLAHGMLWISAFFNYALPTAMLCAAVGLLRSVTGRERAGLGRGAACAAWLFLCGATTEQSGLTALALAGYFLLKALFLRRHRGLTLASALAALGGLLTIFLSPATLRRLNSETGRSLTVILKNVLDSSREVSACLAQSVLTALLLAVLFLMTGILASERLSRRWPAGLGAALAALSLLTLALTGDALAAVTLLLLALAGGAGLALLWLGRETEGLLTLMGLVSLAVMLPTISAEERGNIPLLLCLLAACTLLADRRLRRGRALPGALFNGLLLAASLAAAVPFIAGMVPNYRLDLVNRENTRLAHETGELRYCIDYDLDYTWVKIVNAFSEEYLEGEGLPADTPIVYYSDVRPNVFVGEDQLYPTLVTDGGDTLFWVRLLESFGGETVVRDGYRHLTLSLPWQQCDVDTVPGDDGAAVFTWTTPDGAAHTLRTPRVSKESRTWFGIEVYREVFGLEFRFDEGENAYYVSAPEG